MTRSEQAVEDQRALAAARDNAQWCDLVCRSHGCATAFHDDVWLTETRSPRAYPDAVTLRRSAVVADVLARVDRSAGCSVKDSFAALDLSDSGFDVLFEAEWIHRPTWPDGAVGALSWRSVADVDELEAWATAHGGGAVFRPALLGQPAVAVLVATDKGGGLAAGVIGSRSGDVVGLSNLFTVSADPDEVWAGAAAAVSVAFPGLSLVGYERGDDLSAARRAGFETVGPLRVWVAA